MTPYLLWGLNQRAEFHSLEELEQLLELLTAQAAKDGMPIAFQVQVTPETAMLFSVGREECHLEFHSTVGREKNDVAFYSETHGPRVVISRGPWDSDERIEFDFMAVPSTAKKRYCVPRADALKALKRYVETGTRPDNISWEG